MGDLIGRRREHAAVVAGHAGDAVDDDAVSAAGIVDDVSGGCVQAFAFGIGEQVGLQAVGQIENDLAAVMLELIAAVGGDADADEAERSGEEVAAGFVLAFGVEVVAFPIRSAVALGVALDHAVALGDTAFLKAGAQGATSLEIAGEGDTELLFQRGIDSFFAIGTGQLQCLVIKRWLGESKDEPVGTDTRQCGVGDGSGIALRLGATGDGVGVEPDDALPELGLPTVAGEVDAEDGLLLINGDGADDVAAPGEAVEELVHGTTVEGEFGIGEACGAAGAGGIGEIGEGEVTNERDGVAWGELFQIG